MTQVITYLSRKGGVGKSSMAINVGGCLAESGLKVLLIDMESQASLSQFFLGPQAVERLPTARTVSALFDESCEPDPDALIHATAIDNVWLIPATAALSRHERPQPQREGAEQFALRDLLAQLGGRFDAVMIDTPPFIYGMLVWASLMASGHAVVPVQPEAFSAQALIGVRQLLAQASDRFNPGLGLAGVVVNMRDSRSALHRLTEAEIRRQYGGEVFEAGLPKLSAFGEAIAHQKPVTLYKPKSDAAAAVAALSEELSRRVGLAAKKKTRRRAA